jgi:hypothetical protein
MHEIAMSTTPAGPPQVILQNHVMDIRYIKQGSFRASSLRVRLGHQVNVLAPGFEIVLFWEPIMTVTQT